MEGQLFYFSPGGTCRAVAETLRTVAPGVAVDLTSPVERSHGTKPDKGKLFTLIFPVYAQRMPRVLRHWLTRSAPRGGACCLIACYGGVTVGNALWDAAEVLTDLGVTVVAGAELPGGHAFDCAETGRNLHNERTWTEEELTTFFRAALQKAEAGGEAAEFPRRWALGERFPQDLLAKLATPYPAPDTALCTHCGKCAAVCPVAATEHTQRCIRCTACVRACPTGARRLRFRTPVPPHFIEHGIQTKKTARYIV